MLAKTTTKHAREHMQGRRLQAALKAKGIQADNVTRNRRTGVYTVRFGSPDVTNFYGRGTEPARAWAQRIRESFDDVEIIDMFDSVAEWRPQRPVLFATVFLRVHEGAKVLAQPKVG